MILLQGLQATFIALDSRLQLANIFGATLPKSRLGLSVALLTFFGGSVDLERILDIII